MNYAAAQLLTYGLCLHPQKGIFMRKQERINIGAKRWRWCLQSVFKSPSLNLTGCRLIFKYFNFCSYFYVSDKHDVLASCILSCRYE